MFEIKLATGDKFTATGVSENYNGMNGSMYSKTTTLNIECNEKAESLEHYQGLLEKEGALETITVSVDGKEAATFNGYTEIQNLQYRLLSTGTGVVSIMLLKGDPVSVVETVTAKTGKQ